MRYISPYHRLTLYDNKGNAIYIFRNGELVIGDSTTFNGADLTSLDADYAMVDAHSVHGVTTNLMFVKGELTTSDWTDIEKSGMGYLDGGAIISETVTPIESGWQGRLFFPAPVYDGTEAAIDGAWYKVISGKVAYKGVTYKAGKVFKGVDTTNITIVDAGTYSLELPPELRQGCTASLDEQFKIKHLEWGDEPLSYFNWDTPSGYEPRNSLLTSDAGFIGYSR